MLTVFLSNVSSMFFCTCACLFLWPNLWFYEKAEDVEVARGHQGSAKVHVEAFMIHRILVAKVNLLISLIEFFLANEIRFTL